MRLKSMRESEGACSLRTPMGESRSPTPELSTFLRLQRWRRRERSRWPGLFRDTLAPAHPAHTVTLRKLRSGHFRLHLDDVPIILCDACGALLKRERPLSSSDSTLPPPSQDSVHHSLHCPVCGFTIPLGTLRRLMVLPPCGPNLDQPTALSLLIEAVGVEAAIKQREPDLHSWFLDRGCRMAGFDALLGAVGIREEQLFCALTPLPSSPNAPVYAVEDIIDTERFIKSSIPESVMPPLPYSVTDLLTPDSHSGHEGHFAAERAAELVAEASRIWRSELTSGTQRSALVKIQALGREYVGEQSKARTHNHTKLTVPRPVQVTQPQHSS